MPPKNYDYHNDALHRLYQALKVKRAPKSEPEPQGCKCPIMQGCSCGVMEAEMRAKGFKRGSRWGVEKWVKIDG